MAEWEQEEASADAIGERLKSARESQGLSLDDVAAKTRVPIRHLMHMERGEWDELPAPTYSVGFARAYASAVGLNASEIGSELRTQLVGTRTATATQSYYQPADPARVPPRSLVMGVGAAVILLVIVYFIWRSTVVGDEDTAPVAQAELPPAAAPAAPPPPAPAAAGGPVVLTALSDVWLRVYEAGGTKLFENTLKAGERFEVPATATSPQILTGRPDAVRVTVGGREIPPLGGANRTIADVSLLPADLLAWASAQPAPAPVTPPAPAPKAAAASAPVRPRQPAAPAPSQPPAAPAPAAAAVEPAPPSTPPAGTP